MKPFLGLSAAALLAGVLVAAPAPVQTTEEVKDRTSFLPVRKYQPLPGKVIGVMASDVAKVMSLDGRSGPADSYGFSRDTQSYRWMYVPVPKEQAIIQGLQVQTGKDGAQVKVYPLLNMANPNTVKQWKIEAPYSLVEVEVNDTLGAPAQEGFVATKMTQLDGTKEYPIKVAAIVEDMKKKYTAYKSEQDKAITTALSTAQEKALKDKKPTGPRETSEIFYITWVPETERVKVVFRTTITDGHYVTVGGGIERQPIDPVPPGLPPARGGALRPPPPPREGVGIRTGTTFGVEFGAAYEVSKNGELVKTSVLPIESFQKELPIPPGVPPKGGPRPLPVDR